MVTHTDEMIGDIIATLKGTAQYLLRATKR
jgi:hypothetical protein